jgi:ubiquinone/menaquinone biosynthesis C-methylase UbiE
MTPAFDMDFSGEQVAAGYDDRLVPVLFDPWAERLVAEHGPWEGLSVLDLATGTGVVARRLADAVGSEGHILATDISAAMLERAARRCADVGDWVTLVETPAAPLAVPDASVDVAVCQQAFQFFPDRSAAAVELCRVLRPGGRFVATMWLPVESCEFFGSICASLEALDLNDLSQIMRVAFDFMPEGELPGQLRAAGFTDVRESRQEAPLIFEGGVDHAFQTARSTPIGASLRALPDSTYAAFRAELTGRLTAITEDGKTMGAMFTSLVTARKA